AAFRVLFGGLLLWEVVRYFQAGWIERYYIAPTFHFTYPFLGFIQPWPGDGMYVHFAMMGVLAACIALGLGYRLAVPLFCLAFTYLFLIDKANYLNHFYLIVLFSFLLSLIPAHHAFSLDRWLFFPEQAPLVPRWSVLVLRAQMLIVYFYAGLAKLNSDWLQGEPMRLWLAERTGFPLLGPHFTSEWMVYLFAYGGFLFDLSIGFLLLWPRTRRWALGAAALFHLINSQLFQIGIFPVLAFAATSIFAEPDWPRRWLRGAGITFPATTTTLFASLLNRRSTYTLLVVIHLYLLAQLLIPLRHWLYPGEVSWTEEGHRFAWHMKLRNKEARLRLFVTDSRTGDTWEVSPSVDLSARQLDEMSTRPDMILQYVHHLAKRLSYNGGPRPIVRVEAQVSLNGRPFQPLIDPNVNLADAPVSWGPAPWILPLVMPLAAPQTLSFDNDSFLHADR
ncbi:MAG: HTTM domain-containing protein, partial [Anaerolineales bacterium]